MFEDKYDGFRMVAKIEGGKVTRYSRNGKIISRNYIEVAEGLENIKGDAVIDGELTERLANFAKRLSARRFHAQEDLIPWMPLHADTPYCVNVPVLRSWKRQ